MFAEEKIIELLERLCKEVSEIKKAVFNGRSDSSTDETEVKGKASDLSDEDLAIDLSLEDVSMLDISRDDELFAPQPVRTRDKTRYLYKERLCLKNRLVYEVVSDYVKNNPQTTREKLKRVFPKDLQGSLGVVENAEIAENRGDYKVRFFADNGEELQLADGKMYVCSQWGIVNIPRFLKRAGALGFKIEEVKD